MGFLDNLLKKGAADALRDILGGNAPAQQQQSAPQQQSVPQPAPQQESPQEPSPSGWSWGENMPDEENQYNFNGTYDQYFDKVLREAFPEYDITMTDAFTHSVHTSEHPAKCIIFKKDGEPVLTIELVSRRSSRKKLQRECRAAGIPYLRFYYDYHGWWNTKSYVTERTRSALKR